VGNLYRTPEPLFEEKDPFSNSNGLGETVDSLLMVQKYTALREMLPSFAQTSCFPFLDPTKNVRGKEWKA